MALNRPISALLNLGPSSAIMLGRLGVADESSLRELGCVDAYCLLKAQGEQVSLNLLWAMYGALNEVKWNEVSAETKAQLREQVKAFQFTE